MELRHLATFTAVAEEGSFTRAAGRLHVVQSAVSSHVRALERADGGGDGGLDDVQPPGRAREAALLGDGGERGEVAKLHHVSR